MDESDLEVFMGGLSEWFVQFGFSMKVETPVRVFEQIEFCRMHPVLCGDGWVMVRNPLEAVMRDCTTILSLPNLRSVAKWWHAVGMGGMALTNGVPVAHSLYSQMVEQGIAGHTRDDPWLADSGFMRLHSSRPAQPITPEARVSFWLAFGITPDAQVAFESRFKLHQQWAPGVCPLAGQTWNKLLTKDG